MYLIKFLECSIKTREIIIKQIDRGEQCTLNNSDVSRLKNNDRTFDGLKSLETFN